MFLASTGLLIFLLRSFPWGGLLKKTNNKITILTNDDASTKLKFETPLLSIVIPVRNEVLRLAPLLESMKDFSSGETEIIFIDDESTDGTSAYINSFGLISCHVIESSKKPEGWIGKSWACQLGAKQARGKFILFSDADTVLIPGAIKQAINEMNSEQIDLVSAIPYHLCFSWWERLLGPFHLLTLTVVQAFDDRIFQTPRKYTYGIGQFLLFKKSVYNQIGGHESVKSIAAEDIALVQRLLQNKKRYKIFSRFPLYKVRMFATFAEFTKGWLRLQAIGLRSAPLSLTAEAFLIQCGWAIVITAETKVSLVAALVLFLYIYFRQRKLGQFSVFGALLFPLNQLLFLSLSIVSVVIFVIRRGHVTWRGRTIKA